MPAPPVTTTQLPAGVEWEAINNRGQVVGVTQAVPGDQRVRLWDDGQVADLGPYGRPPNPYCSPRPNCQAGVPPHPAINDRGQVAFYQHGHAVIWQDGQVVDLDGDADYSWIFGLNDRGEALVLRFTDPDPATVGADGWILGVWRRGRFTEVASGSQGLATGLLSEGGHVVVRTYEPGCACTRAFLWHRGERADLPVGFDPTDVNERAQIVGVRTDPATREAAPVLWARGEAIRLPTLGDEQVYPVDINDRGQIVGHGTPPGTDRYRALLWQNGAVTDIGTPTGALRSDPVGINERGEVLIQGDGENGRRVAFLWRRGRAVPLPPDDQSWTVVEVGGFNDRSQVFGRSAADFGSPSVATLWHVER